MDVTRKDKELVWVQILYLFLIPIMLLYYKIIPSSGRILMLVIVTILIYGIARFEKWNRTDFGVRINWKEYFLPYLISNNKKYQSEKSMFLLNLFLGWTIIAWIILLIIALTYSEKNKVKKRK